ASGRDRAPRGQASGAALSTQNLGRRAVVPKLVDVDGHPLEVAVLQDDLHAPVAVQVGQGPDPEDPQVEAAPSRLGPRIPHDRGLDDPVDDPTHEDDGVVVWSALAEIAPRGHTLGHDEDLVAAITVQIAGHDLSDLQIRIGYAHLSKYSYRGIP